jgi:hypothetical protein
LSLVVLDSIVSQNNPVAIFKVNDNDGERESMVFRSLISGRIQEKRNCSGLLMCCLPER